MNRARSHLAPAFALALAAPLFAAPEPARTVTTERAWTRFQFNPELLASYGFEIDPAVDRLELEAAPPAGFVVDATGSDFEGIRSGSLHHSEGFTLRYGGKTVAFAGFDIRPGDAPLTLDLIDARGRRLFRGDQMHFSYEPKSGRLRLENVDVRISAELAAELGEPRFDGLAIAVLELEATTRTLDTNSPEGSDDCSPAVWSGDVDVDLSQLFSVQQIARSDGKVAINLSTQLRNVGTADVVWRRKFLGSGAPYNNDQHPYLVWAAYRIAPISGNEGAPTSAQMLGKSGLKHAFFATNQPVDIEGCRCAGGQILWSGVTHATGICADVYGTGNNDDPRAVGPRDELEAHTGIWVSTGSYFDQNSDGICDWDVVGGGDTTGPDCDLGLPNTPSPLPFELRLAVNESDLSTANASYYIDAWYIVRDDVNIFNTMGWKPMTPAFAGGSWTFGVSASGTPPTSGSVLDAWVPFGAAPAGTSHERIDTGVGHLSLAARTTDLGGGQWHYEYALANHDFDRKVQSFRVPFPSGTAISNAAFRGLGNGGGADWTIATGDDAITFQAPADANVNALDWGTLFSFGFDANIAPATGSTDLGALEQTPDLIFAAPAVTPGGALGGAIFCDDFESAGSGRWSGTG